MELRGEPRGPAIADDEAGRVLGAVLDSGINLIDTSVDYGKSEELIGRYVGGVDFIFVCRFGFVWQFVFDILVLHSADQR